MALLPWYCRSMKITADRGEPSDTTGSTASGKESTKIAKPPWRVAALDDVAETQAPIQALVEGLPAVFSVSIRYLFEACSPAVRVLSESCSESNRPLVANLLAAVNRRRSAACTTIGRADIFVSHAGDTDPPRRRCGGNHSNCQRAPAWCIPDMRRGVDSRPPCRTVVNRSACHFT